MKGLIQYLYELMYKRYESQSMGFRSARLIVRGVEQPVVAGLYADDTVLLAESDGVLQRIVDEFDRVCKRRKLKVNAGKSKMMVFERAREQTWRELYSIP